MVTVAGTVGATVAALICYPRGEFFVGTLFIWAFVMFDMVDGAAGAGGAGGWAWFCALGVPGPAGRVGAGRPAVGSPSTPAAASCGPPCPPRGSARYPPTSRRGRGAPV